MTSLHPGVVWVVWGGQTRKAEISNPVYHFVLFFSRRRQRRAGWRTQQRPLRLGMLFLSAPHRHRPFVFSSTERIFFSVNFFFLLSKDISQLSLDGIHSISTPHPNNQLMTGWSAGLRNDHNPKLLFLFIFYIFPRFKMREMKGIRNVGA